LRRQEIWRRYDEAFAALPVGPTGCAGDGTRHALHLYTLLIDEERCGLRGWALESMTRQNISVGVLSQHPEHPFYQERFGWRPEEYPHAQRIGRQTVSIPLSARLTDEDVDDVIAAVRRCLKK
jgi:dTDP-4-amino-4,6-dideoxygalactose transaminase